MSSDSTFIGLPSTIRSGMAVPTSAVTRFTEPKKPHSAVRL